jgi:hypothetical protein
LRNFRKPVFILISAIILIGGIVILFISPVTKYLIEKYDEQYMGRKITIDWAYVNPFTGAVYIKNLNIYERDSHTIFFSAKSVRVNISMTKLLFGTYEVSELTVQHPRGFVIQNRKELNLDDLVAKISTKEISDPGKRAAKLSILNIKIVDGEFHYLENQIPIKYFIKNVNIESTGLRWDADTVFVKFSFLPGTGNGDASGDFTINFKNLDYRLSSVINKFDLKIIEQYLKELTNYGSFSASLDATISAKGNLENAEVVNTRGNITISDFRFGKNQKDDYARFDKLAIAITELSPNNHKYRFDSILLSRPYFKYERYDNSDNLETMFGKNGANISVVQGDPKRFNLVLEISRYVKILARNFFNSSYKINHFAIYNGDIKFNDYSLSEKFSIDLNPLNVFADSIDKNHEKVNVRITSGIIPYGNGNISLSISPRDSLYFDLNYNFEKIPVSIFNPYTIAYTSYPLDRGTIQAAGTWNVRNGIIKSENHLVIIDPRVTRRIKNKNSKWLPMSLIMSFIRERGNVIDYEIPITDNLKNPDFRLHDIISDVFTNIFVKPVTTPYRVQVKNAEIEIEKSLILKWEMRQNALWSKQEYFIEKMAEFLAQNSDASIVIYPMHYSIKEKEYILFFEAKKKYFLQLHNKGVNSLDENDLSEIDKMSVKDSQFNHYLNKHVKDPLVFTTQEKCTRIVDSSLVVTEFKKLSKEREKSFLRHFRKSGVESQISFSAPENTIPYNGFSFYKISYKGEFPESLIKANWEMNKLNNEVPRNKFKTARTKNKNML